MDLVGQWIEERCQLDKAAFTTSSDRYLNYKFWSMGENEFTFTKKRFSSELVSRGFKSDKVGGKRGFKGIKFKVGAKLQDQTRPNQTIPET